jgi:hypothetical protein
MSGHCVPCHHRGLLARTKNGGITRDFLTIKIEFGRVLQAQYHRLALHSQLRLLPVRRHDVRQSTDSLPRKRYAAMVSPQPSRLQEYLPWDSPQTAPSISSLAG